jgi:hypothetical protein
MKAKDVIMCCLIKALSHTSWHVSYGTGTDECGAMVEQYVAGENRTNSETRLQCYLVQS